MVNEVASGTNEAGVRQVIQDWAGAVRRKDLAAILRNHSSNILMFDVPPPLQSKGIDAYRRTWDVFFSWSRDPVKFEIVEMTVTAGTEVAFVAAVMRCAGRESNGEDIELEFRLTVGLQKINGQWVITHEHHSIPAQS
jgi:ketosteroid isomerase-like protein